MNANHFKVVLEGKEYMIPRNDNLWVGLAVSLIVTAISYFLFLQLAEYFSASAGRTIVFKPRTLALLAISLNIIPMNIFRRTYRSRSMKGLLIGVMAMAMAWFFYYGLDLLEGA